MTTVEMIEKSTMFAGEKFLLVPQLKEVPGGEVVEEDITQEPVDESQTDWEGPYTVKKQINDIQGCLLRLSGQEQFITANAFNPYSINKI